MVLKCYDWASGKHDGCVISGFSSKLEKLEQGRLLIVSTSKAVRQSRQTLNHPEGILFKDLPSYRNELAEIYRKLRPGGLTERALQSIEDVTNPLLNSINEKCARIRGAFVGQFDDHMARHYYIDGRRGEAKKISLPRELVVALY